MQLKLFLVTSMRHGQNRWLNRLSTLSNHSCIRIQALFPTQKSPTKYRLRRRMRGIGELHLFARLVGIRFVEHMSGNNINWVAGIKTVFFILRRILKEWEYGDDDDDVYENSEKQR